MARIGEIVLVTAYMRDVFPMCNFIGCLPRSMSCTSLCVFSSQAALFLKVVYHTKGNKGLSLTLRTSFDLRYCHKSTPRVGLDIKLGLMFS